MSFVWRLASGRYATLAGEGARLVGGRWNSPGRPVVSASESLALCLAECLVHVTGALPRDYVAFKIEIPDGEVESIPSATLAPNWRQDPGYTREIGDRWLREARTVALAVPSAVLADSTNLLLNPLHPAAQGVRIVDQQPFQFDPRLRPPG
ncbi:MAG TPA: RES family NAD+ phosphorylase [Longimicrobium sp.]|nr:RES family NAD+ phosphorylase [Longimicrobium sp.]